MGLLFMYTLTSSVYEIPVPSYFYQINCSPNRSWNGADFPMFAAYLYFCFFRVTVQMFCQIFYWVFYFFFFLFCRNLYEYIMYAYNFKICLFYSTMQTFISVHKLSPLLFLVALLYNILKNRCEKWNFYF